MEYSIYEVPLLLEARGLPEIVAGKARLSGTGADLGEWRAFVERLRNPQRAVRVAMVGKYVELHDAYLSIREALIHASAFHGVELDLHWVHAEHLEARPAEDVIGEVDGMVLCPGFGDRGLEGKIEAVRYARERRIPFLGVCLGLQMMVCEFARNVAGMPAANTTEVDTSTPFPVISLLSEQRRVHDYGGTMRLGGYDCRLVPGTNAAAAYGTATARERHRHRYEVNNAYLPAFQEHGLVPSGWTMDGRLVEIMELRDHPWMVGVQFHPEFTSRPHRPQPLFRDFIRAAAAEHERRGGAVEAGSA